MPKSHASKAGYYAWREREASAREKRDVELTTAIEHIHAQSRKTYGSPSVCAELRARGERVGRKRVARLMRHCGLAARKRRGYRSTTDSKHAYPIVPNLLQRRFHQEEPNRVWVSDITYFSTANKWLYLAVVINLYSRRVIGWSMSKYIDAELVLNALRMAIGRRGVQPGLIVHTDRGSQYACRVYRAFLTAHGITPSMSRKRDCWDNAVAESFFSSLKIETDPGAIWKTHDQARTAIFEYIETWYNSRRRHSTNSYLSPIEFEKCRIVAQLPVHETGASPFRA